MAEEHKCEQVANLKRLDKIIFGNGQLGLIKDVEKLKETVCHMNSHLESLSVSYESLAESKLRDDAMRELKEKNVERFGNIIMRATAIIGAAGVIMTAIIKFG